MLKHRNDNYQQISFSDVKRKIGLHLVELRKTRRTMEYKQKRAKHADKITVDIPPSVLTYLPTFNKSDFHITVQHLKLIIESPPDKSTLKDALSMLRINMMHSMDKLYVYVEANIIEICLNICSQYRSPGILSSAFTILSNISSGPSEYSQIIVHQGGISTAIKIIEDLSLNRCQDPIWLLSNLAVEGQDNRRSMRELGILTLLQKKIEETSDITYPVVKVLIWFYSTHFTEIYVDNTPETQQIIEFVMGNFLTEDTDDFASSLRAAASMCAINQNISLIIELGILKHLKKALQCSDTDVFKEGVVLMGMICSGEFRNVQVLLSSRFLDYLEPALRHEDNFIRNRACWTISNIAGENLTHVKFLKSHSAFQLAIDCLFDTCAHVRLEAAHVLHNTLFYDTEDFKEVLSSICSALSSYVEIEFLSVLIDTCHRVLDKQKDAKELFESSGCLTEIEKCSNHSNRYVSERSSKILEVYFN